MITLEDRINRDGIGIDFVLADPPAYADDGWDANWYRVTLTYQGRRLVTPYGMGLGLTEDPTAEDVLNSLILDASGYENARDFEDWASEYGYDTDSRRAYRTWQQVEELTEKLRAFLGDEYDAYLYDTEQASAMTHIEQALRRELAETYGVQTDLYLCRVEVTDWPEVTSYARFWRPDNGAYIDANDIYTDRGGWPAQWAWDIGVMSEPTLRSYLAELEDTEAQQ